jgi:uncharacterized protein DUF5681
MHRSTARAALRPPVIAALRPDLVEVDRFERPPARVVELKPGAEGENVMSKSDDKERRGSDAAPDAAYKVGNKKPPLHSRFKPGQSGNPSGRRKGRSNFGTTLMKEFCKTIPATLYGKPVKVSQERLFAASIVKDGITKGPQSKALLAGFIERLEARLAAEAEARKKAEAEKPEKAFDWGEEQEELIKELARITGRELESLGSDEKR